MPIGHSKGASLFEDLIVHHCDLTNTLSYVAVCILYLKDPRWECIENFVKREMLAHFLVRRRANPGSLTAVPFFAPGFAYHDIGCIV